MNKEIEEILEDYDCTPELVELIKDKDEEIRDLEKENKKLKDKVTNLTNAIKNLDREAQRYFDMLMEIENDKDIIGYACDLEDKICYLNERINKALEYINEKNYYPVSYYHCLKELRDILKGDE